MIAYVKRRSWRSPGFFQWTFISFTFNVMLIVVYVLDDTFLDAVYDSFAIYVTYHMGQSP